MKVNNAEHDSTPIIDFIGIGAMKAGTTWLNDRLAELPDVYIPPIKEVHYFDRSKMYPSPNTFHKKYFFERVFYLVYLKRVRDKLLRPMFAGDFTNLRWKLNYFFGVINDAWYQNLFSEGVGCIKGEITPAYSMLSDKDVSRIFQFNRDVKIILILRDPVSRAWSHFKHSNEKLLRNSKTNLDLGYVKRFLNEERQVLRSDYESVIEKYKKQTKKGNFMICFYDEIRNDPYRLVSEVAHFIGANSDQIKTCCNLDIHSNTAKTDIEMPQEIECFLIEKYRAMVSRLSDLYGSYFNQWLRKYDNNKSLKEVNITKPSIVL